MAQLSIFNIHVEWELSHSSHLLECQKGSISFEYILTHPGKEPFGSFIYLSFLSLIETPPKVMTIC